MRILFLVAFIVLVDFYFYQAVKHSFKKFTERAQKIIKVIYWSIPVLFLVFIVLAFVLEGRTLFPVLMAFTFEYEPVKSKGGLILGIATGFVILAGICDHIMNHIHYTNK